MLYLQKISKRLIEIQLKKEKEILPFINKINKHKLIINVIN